MVRSAELLRKFEAIIRDIAATSIELTQDAREGASSALLGRSARFTQRHIEELEPMETAV